MKDKINNLVKGRSAQNLEDKKKVKQLKYKKIVK